MTSKTILVVNLAAFMLAIAVTTACGNHHDKSRFVARLDVKKVDMPAVQGDDGAKNSAIQKVDDHAASANMTSASTAVTGSVTFNKSVLFDQEFLYGFDLQYSSSTDAKLALLPQAEAMGHVPCFFRRLGGELQLVANQNRLFESNVNHPELLIASYKIVAEDDATLTVVFATGGVVLNQVANGPKSPAPRQVWIRSLSYVEKGNYLLQETGLLQEDGSVQTFMESVFPRVNIVPEGYKGIEARASWEPLANRYRFLAAETVYVEKDVDGKKVRLQTEFASRFNLVPGGTIDWYVTNNLPDDFMPVIRSGVEGWNRYFNPIFGYNVMRFIGKLPADAKLGDPRYNVIDFDSVAQAGAAYESQATDPLTGIQSHSLIYMPYAWYNIGADLWSKRIDLNFNTSAATMRGALEPKGTAVVFGNNRRVLNCVKEMADVALPPSLLVDGLTDSVKTKESLDLFARRLMIATLFHEVGHALGLAHNFKGSLAFNDSQPISMNNLHAWSTMDYNFFQLEQGLFREIGGSDGPELEYDRQVISQLYHGGKEVSKDDKVIPACADDEADNTDGGLDPLCTRYDVSKNPAAALASTLHNVVAATGAQSIEKMTLTEALTSLNGEVAAVFADGQTIGSLDQLKKSVTVLGNKTGNLIAYYLGSGAQSLRGNLHVNDKALRVWRARVDADQVSEEEALGSIAKDQEAIYRRQVSTVLQNAVAWRGLPELPQKAVYGLADTMNKALLQNSVIGKDEKERAAFAAVAVKLYQQMIDKSVQKVLISLRVAVYGDLVYNMANPFALRLTSDGDLSGFETLAATIVAGGTMVGLDNPKQIVDFDAERLAAAKALASFKGVSSQFDDTCKKLQELETTGLKSGNTALVTAVRKMLKVLIPGEFADVAVVK